MTAEGLRIQKKIIPRVTQTWGAKKMVFIWPENYTIFCTLIKDEFEEDCEKVPHKKCELVDVPKNIQEEKCHTVTIPKCKSVPKEQCTQKTVPKCKKVPEEVCKTEYKEECKDEPKQVPVQEKVTKCVWPNFREFQDSPCRKKY